VKVASQQQVAANFADYVKASQKGPVVVTDNGEPVAVLLKATGKDDLERLLMGHSEKLQAILQAARQRFREGGAQNVETVSTSGTQRHADVLPPSRLWRASATGERFALTAVVRVTGNHRAMAPPRGPGGPKTRSARRWTVQRVRRSFERGRQARRKGQRFAISLPPAVF
jgi:prevent-host-death family protein